MASDQISHSCGFSPPLSLLLLLHQPLPRPAYVYCQQNKISLIRHCSVTRLSWPLRNDCPPAGNVRPWRMFHFGARNLSPLTSCIPFPLRQHTAPRFRFAVRRGRPVFEKYKDGGNHRYVLSNFHTTPLTFYSFLPLCTMSTRNQATNFHHYIPNTQKYHVNHTPSATTTPSQIHTGHASNDVHSNLRIIKPAPATPPAKASSSKGGSSDQKPIKFIHYSPN